MFCWNQLRLDRCPSLSRFPGSILRSLRCCLYFYGWSLSLAHSKWLAWNIKQPQLRECLRFILSFVKEGIELKRPCSCLSKLKSMLAKKEKKKTQSLQHLRNLDFTSVSIIDHSIAGTHRGLCHCCNVQEKFHLRKLLNLLHPVLIYSKQTHRNKTLRESLLVLSCVAPQAELLSLHRAAPRRCEYGIFTGFTFQPS